MSRRRYSSSSESEVTDSDVSCTSDGDCGIERLNMCIPSLAVMFVGPNPCFALTARKCRKEGQRSVGPLFKLQKLNNPVMVNTIRTWCYLSYCKPIVETTSKYYFADSAPYSDSSSTISRKRFCDPNWEGVSPYLLRALTSAPCSSNNRTA